MAIKNKFHKNKITKTESKELKAIYHDNRNYN